MHSSLRHDLIRENEAESLLRSRTRKVKHSPRGRKTPQEVKNVRELAYAEMHRRMPNGRAAVWRPGIVARTFSAVLAGVLTLVVVAIACTAMGAALIYAAAVYFGH